MSGWFHGRPTLAQVEQARHEQRIWIRINRQLQLGRIAAEQAHSNLLREELRKNFELQQQIAQIESDRRDELNRIHRHSGKRYLDDEEDDTQPNQYAK